MKKVWVVVGIIAVIAFIGGGIWWFNKDSGMNNDSHTHEEGTPAHSHDDESSNLPPADEDEAQVGEVTIVYTNNGFEPQTITVRAGTTITIKNDSSKSLQFSSDPHPVHTDNQELNEQTIAPGQSTTITPATAGTWGYHNHLDDRDTGTIIVE